MKLHFRLKFNSLEQTMNTILRSEEVPDLKIWKYRVVGIGCCNLIELLFEIPSRAFGLCSRCRLFLPSLRPCFGLQPHFFVKCIFFICALVGDKSLGWKIFSSWVIYFLVDPSAFWQNCCSRPPLRKIFWPDLGDAPPPSSTFFEKNLPNSFWQAP